MSYIKVSVIVPTYNRERLIRRCVEKIINQTMSQQDYEIILVDDCSTDSTYKILLEYQAEYPSLIRLFQLPENSGGASMPRNKGIDESRGEYIFFVDSDDYIENDTLEGAYNLGSANDADMVYVETDWTNFRHTVKKVENIINENVLSALGPTKFFKRQKLNNLKLRFDPKYRTNEDWLFVMVFLSSTDKISILAEHEYYFRDPRSNVDNHLSGLGMSLESYYKLYQEVFIAIDKSSVWDEANKLILKGRFSSKIAQRTILRVKRIGTGKNPKYQESFENNFDTLSKIINIHLPLEADNYCRQKFIPALTALRKNDLGSLYKEYIYDTLITETEFGKYLDLLKCIGKHYTIIISAVDTPGKFITEELALKLLNLGFKHSLHNKSRRCYIGVIDEGNLIYENLGKPQESINHAMKLFDISLKIVCNFYSENEILSEIYINNLDYSINSRGFNFAIFEKTSKRLIDSVCFDAHTEIFVCSRTPKEHESIEMKHDNSLFKLKDLLFEEISAFRGLKKHIWTRFRNSHRPPLRVYWWIGRKNFGDVITPDIIRNLFGYECIWAPAGYCNLIGAGSVLGSARGEKTCVWGSGLIKDGLLYQSRLLYCAVRGDLTRKRIGEKWKDVTLGDPGLLANIVYKASGIKTEAIGVIPHYVDQDLTIIRKMRADDRFVVMDVADHPAIIAEQVSQCKLVLSSSLHGLVFADSFSIPNIHIHLSNKVIGDGYKFRDYYSAIGKDYACADEKRIFDNSYLEEIQASFRPIKNLKKIQRNLIRSFPY